MSNKLVPLSIPNIDGKEWKYVKDCLDTGWVSSVGRYVDEFELHVADYVNAEYAVATSSGTTALHIALLVSKIGNNDYVIAPNITFTASVNAIKYVGAEPILVDVNEDSWQLDVELLERYLSDNTYIKNDICYHKKDHKKIRAIMPVHILGNMCDMNHINLLAEKYHLIIIEDAAEAMGSIYDDKHAGVNGDIGCFSFNGNKIITCGGGGMIVTDDEQTARNVKHLTTQAKVSSFEYFHDEIGYNYRLVNVLAAIGLAQLEQLPKFLKKKLEIKDKYITGLQSIDEIKFQKIADLTLPNWWLFTIQTVHKEMLLDSLNENHFQSRPLWVPINRLPKYKKNEYVSNNDVSKILYDSCLSLPCSTNITMEEIESVIDLIIKTVT